MRNRFDSEELAAHADAVRALAARIVAAGGVADPWTADDVVQEACVAAIERPPREGVPRRAWFVRVATNLALRARRDAGRRERRERAAAEAAALLAGGPRDGRTGAAAGGAWVERAASAPAAADVAERLEGHRLLLDAVAALDEPYRTAIVLRFFEGLAPPEIAARLGVPVGTVHTHVHRGVARLRARLAPEDDGGRGRRLLLLLAAPEGGAQAPPGTRPAPRPGAPTPPLPPIAPPPLVPLAGVLAMAGNKLVASAALLALALLVGWVAVEARRGAEPRTSPGPVATTTAVPHRGPRAAAATAAQPAEDLPPPVDLAAVDRDLDLHGRVVDESGAAVAGAEVSTFTRPWARTRALVVEELNEELPGPGTRAAADGTFKIRLARGMRVDLRACAPGYAETVRPWCQAGERVEVVLRTGVAVVVSVTDAVGAAVAGADVWLMRGEEGDPGAPRLDARGTTSGDGVCRLDGLPPGVPGAMLQVASERGTFWDPSVATPSAGETRLDVRLRATRRLRGVVTDADTRAPVAGARVSESWTLRGAVLSDAQGAYELPATEDSFQVCAKAPGFAEARAQIGAADRVDVSLRRAARVVGRAVGDDGRPVAGVRIAVCGAQGVDGSRTNVQGVASDDGRFEIAGVRATESFVLVLLAPGHGRTLLDVDAVGTPGGVRDLGDVSLAPSRRISGRVVLSDGSPCPNAIVKLSGANADRSRLRPEAGPGTDGPYGDSETARTDDLGRFAFADQAPGDYGLQAVLSGRKNALGSAEVGAADVDGIELRFVGGHRLVARVIDETGRPVGAAPVTAWTEDRWTLSFVAGADGRVTFESDSPITSLRAGPFFSRLAPGIASETTRVGKDAMEVELRVRRAGWARGRVVAPDGAPLPSIQIQVIEDGRALWQESPFEPLAYARPTGAFAAIVPLGAKVSLVLPNAVLPAPQGGRARALVGRLDGVEAGTEGLVLRAAFADAGRALDVLVEGPDGTPEPGATVHATLWGGNRLPDVAASRTGRARFDDLDAAKLTLWADLQDGHPSRDLWVPPRADVVPSGQEVTLRFREGAPVRGAVVDAAGNPVAGAVVTLYAAEGSAQLATRTTGASGRFALAVAADARRPLYLYVYKLPADANGTTTEFRDAAFEPGDADLTLRLAPPAR